MIKYKIKILKPVCFGFNNKPKFDIDQEVIIETDRDLYQNAGRGVIFCLEHSHDMHFLYTDEYKVLQINEL